MTTPTWGRRTSVSRDEAVAALYAEHALGLFRLAAIVLGDAGAAEDVVQDAFVKLHQKWHRVRDLDAAPAYLRRIVMNNARSRQRHLKVAARYVPPPARDGLSAEDVSVGRERRREMLSAINALPQRQRECIVLRYYAGLSEQEIADTLGISPGTVKSNTSRARAALADALEVTL